MNYLVSSRSARSKSRCQLQSTHIDLGFTNDRYRNLRFTSRLDRDDQMGEDVSLWWR